MARLGGAFPAAEKIPVADGMLASARRLLEAGMREPRSLVVLGLGKASHGDDGLGSALIDLLTRTYHVPEGVAVGDEATLSTLDSARAALLVGAIAADDPPGAFVRLEGEEAAPVVLERLSDVASDWLRGGRSSAPSPLVVLGLVPERIEPRVGLSRSVEAGVAGLVRHIVVEARHLGHEFRPRTSRRVA